MMCMLALLKDALLRQRDDVLFSTVERCSTKQRDDVHDSSDERCCTENIEMMCMLAL